MSDDVEKRFETDIYIYIYVCVYIYIYIYTYTFSEYSVLLFCDVVRCVRCVLCLEEPSSR